MTYDGAAISNARVQQVRRVLLRENPNPSTCRESNRRRSAPAGYISTYIQFSVVVTPFGIFLCYPLQVSWRHADNHSGHPWLLDDKPHIQQTNNRKHHRHQRTTKWSLIIVIVAHVSN